MSREFLPTGRDKLALRPRRDLCASAPPASPTWTRIANRPNCRSVELRETIKNHFLHAAVRRPASDRVRKCALAVCLIVSLLGQASASGQAVTFEDVTVAAGVDYLQWDGVPPAPNLPGLIMTGGAAAGDYDNDGWVDLFVTRVDAPNLLFRNMHDGTFQEVGVAAGVALNSTSSCCAWADVNNDGFLDLMVLTWSEIDHRHLYINDGAGNFTDEAALRGVALTPGGTSQRFASAVFGDYDLDGDLDLFITERNGLNNAKHLLFQNNGSGFFTDVTVAAGVSLPTTFGFTPRFSDINNNGWPDLLIASDFGTSRLFENLGNGQFADITSAAGVGTDENGMGSAVGDIDNDGDLDWFVTSIYDPDQSCTTQPCNWGDSGNRLYRNELNNTFTDATDTAGVRDGYWGWGTTFFDFDNDGDLDLGMTNGHANSIGFSTRFLADPVRLWQNDGTGVMTEVSAAAQFTDTGSGKGFLVLDYDRDGDMDVFIVNNSGHPVLYRNNGGNSNSWLKVRLCGHRTNFFGIGARILVQVTQNGPTQMRELSCGNNYMSQDELEAHFGLGSTVVTTIQTVTVQWPASGLEQVFNNVAANQSLLVEEPVRKGDVNIDAQVDFSDLSPFVTVLVDPASASPLQSWAADLNDDNQPDGADIAPFVSCLLSGVCP